MSAQIELADYIEGLRKELLTAMKRGAGSQLRFAIGEATIELAVAAKREANAKLSFKVFGIGAEGGGGGETTNTQKLTLSLTPVGRDGERLLVADEAGANDF